jgi:LacI family transcriptional regulator
MSNHVPTLDDVARLAGVCKSTASRILGSSPGDRIPFAGKTQIRVRQAAERLGYTPSKLARGLSRTRTGIVGLVIPSVNDSFFPSVTSSIERRLAAEGLNVILANTGADSKVERAKISDLLSWRVDGLVIAPSQEAGDAGLFWELWQKKVPFVLVDRTFPQTPFFSVTTDDHAGAVAVVEHLLAIGRKRIARVCSRIEISTNRVRHAGYVDALIAHGILPDKRYAITAEATPEGGKEALAKVLELTPRPDAMFCFSDVVAAGALDAALAQGVGVPEDLALVGYADLEYSHMFRVPLTTVRQPTDAIGRAAAELLLAQLGSGTPEEAQIRLPVKLVVRDSTQK